MTKRLYYTEAYRRHFTAHVVETLTWQNQPAVILDRTAFYPASGGQPADRGRLNDAKVIDVVEHAFEDDLGTSVVHVLSASVAADEAVGEIDWQRRFDHMQQHTGQHILSAAFETMLDGSTVGFHLGATHSTIDIDIADLQLEDVLPVEAAANQVVWDDRPIVTRFVDEDAARGPSGHSALGDLPPDVIGPIRLIEIPGPSPSCGSGAGSAAETEQWFDVNPCGGTHVARTGEIGMIKVVGLEHQGDKTRLEFLCGKRALQDYEARRKVTATLGRKLTVGTWELGEAVERLSQENKQLRHAERALRERLLDMESAQLAETAAVRGPYQVVGAAWHERTPDELRTLARKLAEESDVVALLFSVNQRTHFCFARAETLDLDVNRLLQEACARLDGKGGGRPQIAQGSAPHASMEQVRDVLRDLERTLERSE